MKKSGPEKLEERIREQNREIRNFLLTILLSALTAMAINLLAR